jgi:hypothetical protein
MAVTNPADGTFVMNLVPFLIFDKSSVGTDAPKYMGTVP